MSGAFEPLDLELLIFAHGVLPPDEACHVRIPHWRDKHVGYDWCVTPATWCYGDDHRLCDAHADEARRLGSLLGINASGRWPK
jgi:hypothetical protein